jgi:hydroxyacylglutathione hydrolase
MKLSDNLFAYVWQGNDNNCNSYVFANTLSNNKHILIDPGHIITPYLKEKGCDTLVKSINQDGLKVEDIGLVFLTHAHPDHIEAAKMFKEKYQALVAVHPDDAQVYTMFNGGKVDLYLEEGQFKGDGLIQTKLEIYHTPGHSRGEVSLYWPEKKAVAVGDVVFFRNTGRVDLPGGDPALLKSSIEKLAKLDLEYVLCGHPYGHPGVIQGAEEIKKNFEFILENIW